MVRITALVRVGCQGGQAPGETGRENGKPWRASYALGSAAPCYASQSHFEESSVSIRSFLVTEAHRKLV